MTARPAFGRALPRAAALLACLALAALAAAAPAAADSFPVTTLEDSGGGSLRAAITAANEHAGPDAIPIEVSGQILLTTPLPAIADATTIAGPGPALELVCNDVPTFRVLSIGAGAQVSISGLTVRGGGHVAQGAGILNLGSLTLTRVVVAHNAASASGGAHARAEGGGIDSEGPLVLREVTVMENSAAAFGATVLAEAYGGGVIAFGPLTVERSTIAANRVEGEGAAGFVIANIGGIDFDGGGLLEDSTVSGNAAVVRGGATETQSLAGGVSGGDGLTVSGSTITGNSVAAAKQAAGANLSATAKTIVRDTIVSNPHGGPSCFVAPASQGFNIDDGSSCGFAQPSDRSLTDPGIDPKLADNGGPTPTHALLPGSAAIDAGRAFGATSDQRRLPRPSDFATIADATGSDGSDVGAFELQAPPPVVDPLPQPPVTDTIAPRTRILHAPPHRAHGRQASFRFAADEAGARFECRLDRRPFRPCRSPWRRQVAAGRHVFQVRAIDAAGNADPSPARYVWRLLAGTGAKRADR
jgi:hypothetical protein